MLHIRLTRFKQEQNASQSINMPHIGRSCYVQPSDAACETNMPHLHPRAICFMQYPASCDTCMHMPCTRLIRQVCQVLRNGMGWGRVGWLGSGRVGVWRRCCDIVRADADLYVQKKDHLAFSSCNETNHPGVGDDSNHLGLGLAIPSLPCQRPILSVAKLQCRDPGT